MITKQQITELIKNKINGLDIYLNILNSVNTHRIDECFESIEKCKKLKNILILFEKYYGENKLNTNFLVYFIALINNINFSYNDNSNRFENLSFENTEIYYNSIKNNIENQIFSNLSHIEFVLETLEKLNFYDNNMVFIGANGAGKSSFANDLKKHFNNYCVAISAQRILNIPRNSHIENITNIQQQLKSKQVKDISNKDSNYVSVITDEFTILLKSLFSENFVVSHQYRLKKENGEEPEKSQSILDVVIKVWNILINHRILESKDGMNLSVRTLSGDEYDANQMSDGEKVVLFCVGQVLLAPENSFIIVDEPELFLNKNIVSKLWDRLEILRSDCVFIYLTHELDFAINRNALKFWIKSYSKSGFEFEKIESNEIPTKLVMELLGSQKPILFCEGKNNGLSYDIKLLSLLLPHFNIKAVESCHNVINYTKAFNKMSNITIEAYGLIDSDFHSNERLTSLEAENIYNFGFCEIENLCLDEDFFQEFAKSISAPINAFEIMKNSIFQELESQKIMQASHFVNSKIDYYYKDSHINKSKTLEELQKNFNNFNQPITVDKWFNSRRAEIDNILINKNYTKAIQIFNNKGLIKKASESLQIGDYVERILRYLSSNSKASLHLLKHFHQNLISENYE